jgi:ATP-dependent metalloprotease FtsH
MNNFEKFGKIVRDDISDRAGLSVTYDMKDYLSTMFPNLNIIGVVNDGLFKEPEDAIERQKDKENREKQTLLKEFANMSHIELKGLNTAQAKDFIRNNPKYLKHTLNQHLSTSMKIEDDAMSNLVEKAAIKMDMALPTSAKVALDRLTFAKVNETDLAHKDSLEPVIISSQDVDNFFDRHSVVMEEFKPKAGQFTLAENIKTKLSDVGGISSIKQEIQEDLIEYLKNPEKFTEERGTAPKGVLLEGPPGTGKTLLARAIAGESNTPFISASGSEFVEMYVGVGAKRVRELFKAARDAAENSPNHTSIVFIDEFDALARARSNEGGNREAEQTLNQLLCEMDGFNNKESKTKVVVIAATNRKDMLDKAAIRPGRFDDVFKVDNPRTEQDRLEIMNIHAKKLNFASEEEKTKILKDTAKLTDGMSGAELAGVMNRAKRIVAKRPDNKVVTYNDMVEAYLQTIAGPVQKNAPERPIEDIIETVRHEGGHATVIDCLNPLLGDKINFITLDKRGNFLGAVFRKPSEMMPNIRSVILSAAVGYAGGLAEPEFDKIGRGAGVSQDVSQATRLFRKAITEWGQGVYTPPITMVPNSHENDTQSNAFYDTLRASNQTNIAKDIALFSATASAIAAMVNNFHKGFLDEYVDNFKANAGKGGNSLSGAEFSKLRHDWVVKNGKLKAEKQMLAKIDKMLTRVMNKNKNIFQRIAMHLFKNV